MKRFATVTIALIMVMSVIAIVYAVNLTPAVKDDPLVRMPGTQPDQGVNLEAPNRCLNCHGGYNQAVEPGYNWMGSMMAQASRDPIFWACLTVAGQDSAWAIGTPNAVDICERCHFPEGWLGGRSDPPNATAMTGSDYDGLHCDFCHTKWDPFFETTYAGTREGNDWLNYWDETNASSTPSQPAADATYQEDMTLAQVIKLFNGEAFFTNNLPPPSYTENATGQYFVSTGSQKRASFADAAARHQMLYSRYHKSKYFCATCHDVSNPVLKNLSLDVSPTPIPPDPEQPLPTELNSAFSYFHVERTWSEFMSSAYGQQGGAATNPEFQDQGAPDITRAAKCQDCHMRDVVGVACNKNGVPIRPDESSEHPNSGQPLHDLTGGNAWISHILASTDPNGPVYDPVNAQLLDQGPAALTLDFDAGLTPKQNGAALMAGSDRAKQQLRLAATIKNLAYSGGNVTFQLQNNSAHKLISGFPEGRRMFVNIQAKDAAGDVIYEVNPYDNTIGTLKGLPHSHSSPALGANEVYVDELVYEVHPSSSLTGEAETFHFVLATGRYKDNRIPPKGFDLTRATPRISEPVWHGVSDPGYFSALEYAGGLDEVSLSDYTQVNFPNNAASVDVILYYQGTSREYVEFLRDEINGNQNLTLPAGAYIIQSDPFFAQLKAWGNTIWQLWEHNHAAGVEGIVPFMMAQATVGGEAPCAPPVPTLLSATPGDTQVTLTWHEIPGDPAVLGYNLYYDQAGKAQFIETLLNPAANNSVDTGLTNGQEYCYKVTSLYDCDDDGVSDAESGFSNILCATPTNPGQTVYAGVDDMQTGKWVTTGKGKNQTTEFVVTDSFNAGDAVVVQAHVVDVGGLPLADATVEIIINDAGGNLVATLLTDPSDASGWAEATWQTQKPNKKGQGGTPSGAYQAVTNNVTVSGYVWDGVMTLAPINIQ